MSNVELTSTAVVRALRTRESSLWPAKWCAIHVKEGVFLLKTKPGPSLLGLLHDLVRVVAEVGLVGSAIIVVALRKDEDVVAATERVFEDGSGTEVDVGVSSGSLVSRRTIEIPDPELVDALNLLRHGLIGDVVNIPLEHRFNMRSGGEHTGIKRCPRPHTHRGL